MFSEGVLRGLCFVLLNPLCKDQRPQVVHMIWTLVKDKSARSTPGEIHVRRDSLTLKSHRREALWGFHICSQKEHRTDDLFYVPKFFLLARMDSFDPVSSVDRRFPLSYRKEFDDHMRGLWHNGKWENEATLRELIAKKLSLFRLVAEDPQLACANSRKVFLGVRHRSSAEGQERNIYSYTCHKTVTEFPLKLGLKKRVVDFALGSYNKSLLLRCMFNLRIKHAVWRVFSVPVGLWIHRVSWSLLCETACWKMSPTREVHELTVSGPKNMVFAVKLVWSWRHLILTTCAVYLTS